jgi:hypothetical protein
MEIPVPQNLPEEVEKAFVLFLADKSHSDEYKRHMCDFINGLRDYGVTLKYRGHKGFSSCSPAC